MFKYKVSMPGALNATWSESLADTSTSRSLGNVLAVLYSLLPSPYTTIHLKVNIITRQSSRYINTTRIVCTYLFLPVSQLHQSIFILGNLHSPVSTFSLFQVVTLSAFERIKTEVCYFCHLPPVFWWSPFSFPLVQKTCNYRNDWDSNNHCYGLYVWRSS